MKEVSYFERVTVRLGRLELMSWRWRPSTRTEILFGFTISTVILELAGKTIG